MMEKSPNAIFRGTKNGGCKWEGTKVNKTAGTVWMSERGKWERERTQEDEGTEWKEGGEGVRLTERQKEEKEMEREMECGGIKWEAVLGCSAHCSVPIEKLYTLNTLDTFSGLFIKKIYILNSIFKIGIFSNKMSLLSRFFTLPSLLNKSINFFKFLKTLILNFWTAVYITWYFGNWLQILSEWSLLQYQSNFNL